MTDFDYSFPKATSPYYKYEHTVSLSNFDTDRIVTVGVTAKKVDNPAAPTPFYEIPIKYDYSPNNDGSMIGPLVVTTDDDTPVVVEWGVNPPSADLMQKSPKIPNHSVKLDLSGDEKGVGGKLRSMFMGVKSACVKLLVLNQKSIGSCGSSAMMSGNSTNHFNALLKAHDMSKRKLPNGDFEMEPAKFLNCIGFTNVDKRTGKSAHVIKTHFFAPDGNGGQLDIHVRDVVKKRLEMHPYIYFNRIYCGATLSIQSFLDSGMIVDVKNAMSREITSSAKSRLAVYNGAQSEKFKAMCKQITTAFSGGGSSSTSGGGGDEFGGDGDEFGGDGDEFGGGSKVMTMDGGGGASAAGMGLDDSSSDNDFDSSLKAVTTETTKPAPKRSFRRV